MLTHGITTLERDDLAQLAFLALLLLLLVAMRHVASGAMRHQVRVMLTHGSHGWHTKAVRGAGKRDRLRRPPLHFLIKASVCVCRQFFALAQVLRVLVRVMRAVTDCMVIIIHSVLVVMVPIKCRQRHASGTP